MHHHQLLSVADEYYAEVGAEYFKLSNSYTVEYKNRWDSMWMAAWPFSFLNVNEARHQLTLLHAQKKQPPSAVLSCGDIF